MNRKDCQGEVLISILKVDLQFTLAMVKTKLKANIQRGQQEEHSYEDSRKNQEVLLSAMMNLKKGSLQIEPNHKKV